MKRMRELHIDDIVLDMVEFLSKYGILFDANKYITTEKFITMLIRNSMTELALGHKEGTSEYMEYALGEGIIEDYDRTMAKSCIERRSVARILHEVLLNKLKELDEQDWSLAEELYDLYSCHTCVMHIAQMYVKGIILSKENHIFDVKSNITGLEAAAIIIRMLDKTQRKPLTKEKNVTVKTLGYEEAEVIFLKEKAKLIDVRTYEEFKEGHIKNSINIPLLTLTINPYTICDNKNIPIILYCTRAYKSKIAAQELIKAGYSKVYILPGLVGYPYDLTI